MNDKTHHMYIQYTESSSRESFSLLCCARNTLIACRARNISIYLQNERM